MFFFFSKLDLKFLNLWNCSSFVTKIIFVQKLPMDISLTFMIKIPHLTPLFFTVNGPKTDLFAIFWLWKIILGYLRFCDQNHFWSKVAYEYKLDIHEKNFTVTPLFQQLMVQKLIFFAIFWLCKIILGYFWFCVQNYYWSKVFFRIELLRIN